jgi:hypothetical protein
MLSLNSQLRNYFRARLVKYRLKKFLQTRKSYFIDYRKSRTTLFIFGGIHAGLGVPVFEFFNTLNKININKVFFRDFNQAWYYLGLKDIGDNIGAIENFIRKLIDKFGSTHNITLGNSMGGYAAIYFGTKLNLDKVISFSPQTFIDYNNRLKFNDTRWENFLSRIYQYNPDDLRNLLLSSNIKTKIKIYYGEDQLDVIHAHYLSGINNVHLIQYTHCDHSLTKYLRDRGELKKIIKHEINEL